MTNKHADIPDATFRQPSHWRPPVEPLASMADAAKAAAYKGEVERRKADELQLEQMTEERDQARGAQRRACS